MPPKTWQDLIAEWIEVHDLTLSLDTSAYADGDVLADRQVLSEVVAVNGGAGMIQSVHILDEDDQGVAMDIVFLDSDVTIGTENAAVSVSDANATKIVGIVEVATGDYVDLVGSQLAYKDDLNIPFKCTAGANDLYVAAITRGGTPTYTASGIKLKIGILPGM